jgi:putative SOS response-associated peptidase YedK
VRTLHPKILKLATFNARVESVTEKPMFRDAFKRHRCLIPASGYYERQDAPDGKQPLYFTRRDGQLVTIAGSGIGGRTMRTVKRSFPAP